MRIIIPNNSTELFGENLKKIIPKKYMKSINVQFILSVLLLATLNVQSQKSDTVLITPSNIKTKVLKDGTHRYLVYFKMAKDAPRTQTQFWTRTIERTTQNEKPVIIVTQQWEDKDSIMHTVKSVCDEKTMKPITHEFWWKQRFGSALVNIENKTLQYNGSLLSDADTAKQRKGVWSAFKSTGDNYFLNWHLDMEVFPTLPYKKGVTFIIPFYDPGTSAPFEKVAYTVTGSAQLIGYDNQKIDCWLLVHEGKGNKEIFWISKTTKEVLKLEQEINGKFYRYKIKLGFSM